MVPYCKNLWKVVFFFFLFYNSLQEHNAALIDMVVLKLDFILWLTLVLVAGKW